jgi:anti-sigma factor RsiW
MRFTDETLMAYADGELDQSTRHAVELAMQADPKLADKVRQHIALRGEVYRAFAGTLDEQVPPRLRQVAQSANVVQLDSVRAARRNLVEVPRRWSWPEWGAIAATLVVGVLAGAMGLSSLRGESQLAAAVDGEGALTAHGKLDSALTRQLASTPAAASGVRIGVTFVSKEGQYCRSFTMGSAAGLACRRGSEWKIPVLAESAASAEGAYRQAGSAMPAAVLDAVDARAAGASLDARAEQAAAQKGWAR